MDVVLVGEGTVLVVLVVVEVNKSWVRVMINTVKGVGPKKCPL